MPVEVWTSPGGNYQVKTYIPDGYENETREEWAERIGLDLSVLQREDTRTPEERAKWRAEALAENEQFFREQGWTITPEEQAELDALMEHLGIGNPNGETASQ